MPVSETIIKAQILQSMKSNDLSGESAQEKFAADLASIIKQSILSATVVVPLGIPVLAPPPTGAGATTAPITCTIT